MRVVVCACMCRVYVGCVCAAHACVRAYVCVGAEACGYVCTSGDTRDNVTPSLVAGHCIILFCVMAYVLRRSAIAAGQWPPSP